MKKIGIGLIGFGYWGPNYARILMKNKKVKFNWICDLSNRLIDEAKLKYQIKTTSLVDQVINDPATDAVIICTPTSTHFNLVAKALKQGKHVMVEKPLTNDSRLAKNLVKQSIHKDKILMVGHTFLYNNHFNELQKRVKKGYLGKIRFISSRRTNLGPIRHDVDVLWDLLPHDLSMILSLVDEAPTEVSVNGATYLKDSFFTDVAFVNLKFPQNILANILVSWLSPIKARELTIVGTDKMAVFDDTMLADKLTIFHKGVTIPPRGSTFKEFLKFGIYQGREEKIDLVSQEPLENEVMHFLDCILNNKKPLSDGENGREIVNIVEKCQEAIRLNRPVKL